MLHIVQVVMWGVAETPQLFVDEEKARSAYVECAQKRWDQRYSAYCEHHGMSRDAFLSAQAFVKTLDVSEKSCINFWTFNPAEIGLGDSAKAPAGPSPEELQEVTGKIAALKEGLTRLVDDVSKVADTLAGKEVSPDSAPAVRVEETVAPPPEAKERKPEPDPEKYKTQEWKNFVGTIKRLCSGSRNDFYLLPRDDWRNDVYSNLTSLEYWDWVADNIVQHQEEAKEANYSVVEDSEAPGYYRFQNPEGIPSESYYSEWEAWCAAGLHAAASFRAEAG